MMRKAIQRSALVFTVSGVAPRHPALLQADPDCVWVAPNAIDDAPLEHPGEEMDACGATRSAAACALRRKHQAHKNLGRPVAAFAPSSSGPASTTPSCSSSAMRRAVTGPAAQRRGGRRAPRALFGFVKRTLAALPAGGRVQFRRSTRASGCRRSRPRRAAPVDVAASSLPEVVGDAALLSTRERRGHADGLARVLED
jgi:hypothetical protein